MSTIVLIGATSGLGRRAAEQLAAGGHRLFLVGRDPERAAALAKQLPDATVIAADVSVRSGVEQVAAEIAGRTGRIDVLINNAGVMTPTRQETAEGIELNLAVHHLAPWSTVALLAPLIPAGGRIVNVNSEGHRSPMRGGVVRLDPARLADGAESFDPFLTYSRTKLANLLFTYELQRRHPEWGVVAVHPGVVRTDLGRQFPRLQVAAISAFALPARRGAEPVVQLATSHNRPTGYYDRFTKVRSSTTSYDESLAREVWASTERLRPHDGSVVRIVDNE
ncbi:short-subunit dehydrogenase [Kribbella rubisoli]|uniref:Short-subunit dehydrogenase n=1 Tax=Kribbella rubisoli TaxID=3075929 RepID=A0A4Q7XAJ9_9ACTN|nr:SDR family NAD(P)-dependent oxidoreductase [Kribbella rubisoli]RZU20250.1 short-subunit dehydrogenase [Kribbella rubisoli]